MKKIINVQLTRDDVWAIIRASPRDQADSEILGCIRDQLVAIIVDEGSPLHSAYDDSDKEKTNFDYTAGFDPVNDNPSLEFDEPGQKDDSAYENCVGEVSAPKEVDTDRLQAFLSEGES